MTALVGMDMLDIARMERPMCSKHFRERVFTADELEYLSTRGLQSAAGIFCAKEAVAKAMGANLLSVIKTIEIGHTAGGQPIVLNPSGFAVSITHTRTLAAATAIRIAD